MRLLAGQDEQLARIDAAMAQVGNPSSVHTAGRQARRRVEEAREDIADALGAGPSEVVFTSGGTESDNLAVKGIYRYAVDADPRRRRLVVSAAEHSAVLDSVTALADREGALISWVDPGPDGAVKVDAVRAAVEDRAAGGPDSVAAVVAMAGLVFILLLLTIVAELAMPVLMYALAPGFGALVVFLAAWSWWSRSCRPSFSRRCWRAAIKPRKMLPAPKWTQTGCSLVLAVIASWSKAGSLTPRASHSAFWFLMDAAFIFMAKHSFRFCFVISSVALLCSPAGVVHSNRG